MFAFDLIGYSRCRMRYHTSHVHRYVYLKYIRGPQTTPLLLGGSTAFARQGPKLERTPSWSSALAVRRLKNKVSECLWAVRLTFQRSRYGTVWGRWKPLGVWFSLALLFSVIQTHFVLVFVRSNMLHVIMLILFVSIVETWTPALGYHAKRSVVPAVVCSQCT